MALKKVLSCGREYYNILDIKMLVFNSPWDNPTPLTAPAREQLVSVRISHDIERNDLACCNFYWQLLGHWCGCWKRPLQQRSDGLGAKEQDKPICHMATQFFLLFLVLVSPTHTVDRERNQYLQWKKVCYWISKHRCRVLTWETKGPVSIFRSQIESNDDD